MTVTFDEALSRRQELTQDVVDVDEPQVKLVIFTLGEGVFAFHGHYIREVLPGDEPLFFVPGMPATIEGVINVRGHIESVMDLSALLGLPSIAIRDSSLLLGQTAQMHSGLRVGRLLDVTDVAESQLQLPPESLPEHLSPFVAALLQVDDTPITLLDLERLFEHYLQHQVGAT